MIITNTWDSCLSLFLRLIFGRWHLPTTICVGFEITWLGHLIRHKFPSCIIKLPYSSRRSNSSLDLDKLICTSYCLYMRHVDDDVVPKPDFFAFQLIRTCSSGQIISTQCLIFTCRVSTLFPWVRSFVAELHHPILLRTPSRQVGKVPSFLASG